MVLGSSLVAVTYIFVCSMNLIDIRLEMTAGICFRKEGGWFDFAFIYLMLLFGFLYDM